MARNAEETRRKILTAATEEFARHGIAGARVDRITTVAGVNNALLYRYFGSKVDLFDTVYSRVVTELIEAVPLDAEDLPGYAGRLFDYHEAHPAAVRLAAWRGLERPESPVPEVVVTAQRDKAARIAAAQRAGTVPSTLPPESLRDLLVLLTLSGSPFGTTEGGAAEGAAGGDVERARRRETVVTAARALVGG
ncbi:MULTISPECIES: TetR family transcriptional regulator [unclassified Streptomyces]|uniref:TetR family transcriptional regulator n=1 Tax=unclassified Streptomyces TaxID=2593676 RepID=UPI000300C64E|nr:MULTISPECIES: TetR family transcriptional regulator [unclassified Streptomyces]ASY32346.1 TetR family transcriptional regulator [Streptomyces sp. CLI2509]MYX23758.1 TetR family transcriptional regulator [Streptomyces sp. SID8380]